MAYQALYRQWRPADFSSMVGQEAVVQTLRNQIQSGRIAHAYLFCGSRGTGKTSTAKIMARAVNCEHPVNGDPCGECPSCRRILREESLDIMEIDAASNNGVDEIRDLRENVKYPPQSGKYKVYIIDEVHMLSAGAFNALLKTLEEPPEYVIFILATTEPQKLLATILSRCQRFDFGRIPAAQIAGRLQAITDGAGATAEPEALNLIARAAEGGMRDAISILDMCLGYQNEVTAELVRRVLGTADRGFLFRFSDALRREDAAGVMNLIDELMRSGREPVVFAKDVSRHLRALLLALTCPKELPAILEITEEDAAEYVDRAAGFSAARLMDMIQLFMAVETELRLSSSPRTALEYAALKACLRTAPADAFAVNSEVELLKRQVAELQGKLAAVSVAAAEGRLQPAAELPAQPAEKKSAPEPKPARPAVSASDAEIFKALQKELSKTNSGVVAFLTFGHFTERQGNTFIWELNEGQDPIYAESINRASEAVNAVLKSLTGDDCTLRAVVPASREDNRKNTGNDVSDLRETFPGMTEM